MIVREIKPLASFHRDRRRKDGRSVYCKPCGNAKSKKWQAENKSKVKEIWRRNAKHYRRHLYGLSEKDMAELLSDQDYGCAICGFPETVEYADGTVKQLAVDHCHLTLNIRGLLCSRCNTGLGYFEDDQDRMLRAILYLERAKMTRLAGTGVKAKKRATRK